MFHDCLWLLPLGILVVMAESLTTGHLNDMPKIDQAMRPKVKRAQELLMFGNQQNRRVENNAAVTASNVYTSNIEKKTLDTSGLEDVKVALTADETFGHPKQLVRPMHGRDEIAPYENNFDYGKIMANEISPRNRNVPSYYSRYYNIGEEDRRKRSEKSTITKSTATTTLLPSSSSISTIQTTPEPVVQAKRSIPIYQEPRYKRGLDRDEFLTLLSLWKNSPRNRNWRNYVYDDYEDVGDDSDIMELDDEEPRNDDAWLAVEPQRHYFSNGIRGQQQALSPLEIGIPRTHPVNIYDQYENQYASPYENIKYGNAQYGAMYPSQSYYPPEKKFLVARKRSQGYDSYNSRNDLASLSQLMNSQPQVYTNNYPHRFVY